MSSVTEPVTKQSRQGGSVQQVQECLDALSSGASDESHFFRAAADLLHKAPEAGWELLGLVDQYHRRGRINAQTFGALKAHLQGLLVGTGTSDDVSAPVPRMQDEPALTVALPPQGAAARPRAGSLFGDSDMPTSPVAAAEPATPAPSPPLTPAAIARPAMTPAGAARPGGAAAAAAHPAAAPPAAPTAAAASSAARHAAGPRTLSPGDLLRGRYLVQGLLGQGGMGTVYAAIDQYRLDRTHGDQQVAIKVLHTEVIQRPRLFAELRREFQHLQSLSHPNIVRVHEFDRDGDLAFFTMEYLSGALLSRVLAAQPSVPLQRPYALALIRDVGSAAAHAHARGVVHSDLNPGNIFITDNGEVRVLDFGASHKLHRHPWISEFDDNRPTPVATPAYASCQVLEGEAADARDDVYALACIAYVLLTGKHPFRDNTALNARTARLEPRRPRGLSTRQWNALRAGLNHDRERRPSDMRAWLDRLDLRTSASLPPLLSFWTARPRRRSGGKWAVAVALAAALAACGWWGYSHPEVVALASDSVRSSVTAIYESVASQVSRKDLSLGGQAEPVIHPPDSTPDTAGTAAQPDAAGVRANVPAGPSDVPRIGAGGLAPTNAAPIHAPVAAAPAGVGPAVAAGAAAAGAPDVPAGAAAASGAPAIPAGAAPVAPAAAAAPAGALRDSSPTVSSYSAATAPTEAETAPGSSAGQNGSSARARIELAADNVVVPPDEPMAHVVVRRSRGLHGDISFNWWTESGTAKPGRDFVPVNTQVEHIENGQSAISLIIPVVVDPARRESRNFYVVIDQPSENAALGPRTLTMVTLPGTDPEASETPDR